MVSFLFSVLVDEDLLKSVLEYSNLVLSSWKRDHPSNTEDGVLVRLSSEDEAESLATQPRVARRGVSAPAAVPVEVPAAVPVASQTSAHEVVVKKRALNGLYSRFQPFFAGKAFLRVLRPGRLLKSPTRF